MGKHDSSYRRFFSQPRMVEGLLRGFVAEPWVEHLDFSTLRKASGSFVSRQMEQREADLVWMVDFAGDDTPACICILIELQSRTERFMAVRFMAYVALLYEALIAGRHLTPARKLPLVVPIGFYNGVRPWRAARDMAELVEVADPSAELYRPRLRYRLIDVSRYSAEELALRQSPVAALFRLEKSRDWLEIHRGVEQLYGLLRSPGDEELRQIFAAWLKDVVFPRMQGAPSEELGSLSLEGLKGMLAERVAAMYRLERMRGRRDGRMEGLEEGRQVGWQEGRQEGRQEGEADLLLRQLQRKFGPLQETALARVRAADSEALLEWGERILTAERLEDVFGD